MALHLLRASLTIVANRGGGFGARRTRTAEPPADASAGANSVSTTPCASRRSSPYSATVTSGSSTRRTRQRAEPFASTWSQLASSFTRSACTTRSMPVRACSTGLSISEIDSGTSTETPSACSATTGASG